MATEVSEAARRIASIGFKRAIACHLLRYRCGAPDDRPYAPSSSFIVPPLPVQVLTSSRGLRIRLHEVAFFCSLCVIPIQLVDSSRKNNTKHSTECRWLCGLFLPVTKSVLASFGITPMKSSTVAIRRSKWVTKAKMNFCTIFPVLLISVRLRMMARTNIRSVLMHVSLSVGWARN